MPMSSWIVGMIAIAWVNRMLIIGGHMRLMNVVMGLCLSRTQSEEG
jgi:hypothetical protein